ncbi:hypothetical protein BKA67DRAFT_556750 [Truncatella angustata]|uniref:EthD domain-containing protein n=1 Tax=Truncatella angustata TaxID=152316 RepID=A0A9P8UTK1_9PEZI|nr:uncharacterized protein BKA67DRAFT_556750 [Truncatella angustata]KAH6657931.1 hypothetical protein BKA67DRAFT_556750 [Truncatella angustata]KAH8195918.1 hypothetical protein TruAng_009931 [Truncatella angustata]
MVFRVYMLAVKAPGITIEEFKEQWDVHHLKLLKEIAGDVYPDVHIHHYPKQVQGPADALYDGIGYLEFKNKDGFLKMKEIAEKPENQARLDKHERTFLDKSKIQMYVVEDEE